ncbi:hypothetical protein [Candidatus Phyllobacterium onerii]|nr:hypothetical protein [Phyllobacterium sp. IY22]
MRWTKGEPETAITEAISSDPQSVHVPNAKGAADTSKLVCEEPAHLRGD